MFLISRTPNNNNKEWEDMMNNEIWNHWNYVIVDRIYWSFWSCLSTRYQPPDKEPWWMKAKIKICTWRPAMVMRTWLHPWQVSASGPRQEACVDIWRLWEALPPDQQWGHGVRPAGGSSDCCQLQHKLSPGLASRSGWRSGGLQACAHLWDRGPGEAAQWQSVHPHQERGG